MCWVEFATPLMQPAALCQHVDDIYGNQNVSVVTDPHFSCNYQQTLEMETNNCQASLQRAFGLALAITM